MEHITDIDKTANLKTSVNDLVMSKSFDNGMICASEQSVIVDKEIHEEFERLMKEAGCYFMSQDETNTLRNSMKKPISNSKRCRNRSSNRYKSISS